MWEREGTAEQRKKQARFFMVSSVWYFLHFLGNDQMGDRLGGSRSLRLVDGDYSQKAGEGARMAVQEVVFGQEKSILLPRLREQL